LKILKNILLLYYIDMPRPNMSMSTIIHNNQALPRIFIQSSANNQPNSGTIKSVSLKNMSFKSPMIDRIAGLKPGCSACGKK